ncbi:nucleotidyltransferase domain-containing protein [Neobacillus drentensis]|uniref:nucleotidyltransferase domain-containing protein n=1 Tax=Neobacillus drentensis TaxID=220684 RepID=UPI003B5892B6
MEKIMNEKLKQFSRELKLLLSIMKRGDDVLDFNNKDFKGIEWDKFIQLSKHHRVFPLIYKRMKDLGGDFIPTSVLQELFLIYQKNIFQMLHLSGETEKISKLFSSNQIRTLFLKGPVLAADLYGDISLRTSADLDVLIPIEKLDQAEEILINEGYKKDEYILTVLNDWKWRHHHITFFHPQKKIKVEIHWRLNPGPAKEPKFDDLWKRKRVSSLTSQPMYTLGLEDLFVFLVSHGARHGWSRLRWLDDIKQITESKINWTKTINLLKRYHYDDVGGQALFLAFHLLNAKVPKEMNNIINRKRTKQLGLDALFYIKQMVNLHTDPVPEEVSAYHKRHLFSLMSTKQKFFFILSFLYPYPEDAEFLPLPKVLHFLYFPLRPIILLLRKTKIRSETRRA